MSNPGLPTKEEEKSPFTLLLPILKTDERSIPMSVIVNILKAAKHAGFDQLSNIKNIESFWSSVVTEVLLEQSVSLDVCQVRALQDSSLSLMCKLHSFPAESTRTLPHQKFGVLKPSAFPSNVLPLMFV